jgi:periplasmic protein TonB
MNKCLIILLIFFCKINIGITQSIVSDSLEIIQKPDQVAEFQGGTGSFGKFLMKNFKYPEAAQRANVSGKVYMEFIVETDSTLSNYNIIKSVGMGLDEEAIRVLKLSPKWIPARHKGKNVRSRFTMPLNICISE